MPMCEQEMTVLHASPLANHDNWIVVKVTEDGIYPPSGWNEPENWQSLEEAAQQASGNQVVAFVTENALTCLDVDKARQGTGEDLPEIVQDWIEMFDGYVEFSKSGTGVHIFFKGDKPASIDRQKFGTPENCDAPDSLTCEVYDSDDTQFIIPTGNIYQDYYGIDRDAAHGSSQALEFFESHYAHYIDEHDSANQSAETDDSQSSDGFTFRNYNSEHSTDDVKDLLERKAGRSDAAQFTLDLWNDNVSGVGDGTPSDKDWALACRLAFWTKEDASLIEDCMRESDLERRDRWKEQAGADGKSYLEYTIDKAIRKNQSTYSGEI